MITYNVNYNYAELKGLIIFMFGTYDAFAKAIKMSAHTVSKKLNGLIPFNQRDIESWRAELKIKERDIVKYFFCRQSSQM